MAHHSKRSTASSHKIQIKSCSCFPAVCLLDAAGGKMPTFCGRCEADPRRQQWRRVFSANLRRWNAPTWGTSGTPQQEEKTTRRGRASSRRVRRPQCEVKKTITFKSIFYCLTHRVSKSVKILNYKKASLDFFKISLLFLLKEQFFTTLKKSLKYFYTCKLLLVWL